VTGMVTVVLCHCVKYIALRNSAPIRQNLVNRLMIKPPSPVFFPPQVLEVGYFNVILADFLALSGSSIEYHWPWPVALQHDAS